ncbi:hypothetical protein [Nocardia mexicana]|uniref:Uncharacterized protein n=1 Tax=Nocardia mexicana TaxID=279262 RepID=A0A370H0K3_9NOCA|nr:hypothetical protein [Nocardia mexicana]RDI49435.1 hypothetical protein DFR68_107563 [Nocardia mexicana]
MAETRTPVRVQMRFPHGGVVLRYRATPTIAARLATELPQHGVDVHIDDEVTDLLADLPHPELWSS